MNYNNNSSTNNNNKGVPQTPRTPKKQKKRPNKPNQNQQNKSSFGEAQKAPVSASQKFTNRGPKISTLPKGSMKISNTEFISSLLTDSNTVFTVPVRLRINAASGNTFRWLSKVAQNFETYKFEELRFHYKPRAPTSQAGSVIIAPDYDAQDGKPDLEVLLGQMIDAVEDAPWKPITVVLRPDRMNRAFKSHFCMDDGRFDTTTQDEKTIDCAQLFIGFDNIGGSSPILTWGKLFVEYTVRLDTPQPANLSLDDGGLRISGSLVNASVNCFTSQPTITQNPLQGIVKNWNSEFPAAYPTGNAGIFLRDYEGLLTQFANGTVMTGVNAPIITQKAGNPVPSVINRMASTVNAAQTLATRTDWIKASAGDFLGLGGYGCNTISGINAFMGGSNLF